MKLFWVNGKKLQVEGKKMTPEKAYKKYPELADEIRKFVLATNFTKVDTKSSIDYFWETSKELIVNGKKMTPDQAYKKYPEHAEELKKFVSEKEKVSTKVESTETLASATKPAAIIKSGEIEYFWVNSEELIVNGEKMTPQQAYKRYPVFAAELKQFVEETKGALKTKVEQLSLEPDISIAKKRTEIQQKIDAIFTKLDITPATNAEQQKENAYKLFKYIIANSHNEESVTPEKQDESAPVVDKKINDVYRCLVQNHPDKTSEVSSLSLLFREAGVPSHHIAIAEKEEGSQETHEVVSLQIGDEKFICDPTLVKTCLEEGKIPEINHSVFAFNKEDFFNKIYPNEEIKFVNADVMVKDQQENIKTA